MERTSRPTLAAVAPWLTLVAAIGFGVLINASPGEGRWHQELPGLTYDEEVLGQPPSSSTELVVTSIQSGGAAENADIAVGDVISTVDGITVGSSADVASALARAPFRPVGLTLTRGGHTIETSLPAPRGRGIMGT